MVEIKSNIIDLEQIRGIINKWFKAWENENKEAISSLLAPTFLDIEKIFREDKLISKEVEEYSKESYVRHAISLWTNRDYIKMKIKNLDINLLKQSANVNGNLYSKLIYYKEGPEFKDNNTVIIYDNIDTSITLTKSDNKWYISSLTNLITLTD